MTSMNLGKTIRLNRLLAHPSGRFCSVAVDHFVGYNVGMPDGLRNLPAAIKAIVSGRPDAITMQKGTATACWPPFAGRIPLVIQSLAGRPDDTADEHIAEPEDAVRLGADAFAACAFIRGSTEAAHLRRIAEHVRQAQRWDMPVILHIYPRQFLADGRVEISFEPEDIFWAVRCGLELGVDIIKVPYTGDPKSYAQIIRTCPIPIVAAGGPKTPTFRDALAMGAGVIEAGARGMVIGRNIWGFPKINQAVLAFKAVIHDRCTPGQALKTAGLK
jgi:fructose-bisphosphate aldolase, class I